MASFATPVKCYDCRELVYGLREHQQSGKCSGIKKAGRQPGSGITMPSTIDCHDCGEQVKDLKSHRRLGKCSRILVADRESEKKPEKKPKRAGRKAKKEKPGKKVVPKKRTAVKAPLKKKSRTKLSVPRRSEQERDFFFLLDVSGSMGSGLNGVGVSRLEKAKDSVRVLADSVRDSDRFSLITFSSQPTLNISLRPMKQIRNSEDITMYSVLSSVWAAGTSTAIYDAIQKVLDHVQDKNRYSLIVVVTDGEDNASKTSLAQVKKAIAEFPKIQLHLVEVTNSHSETDVLRELAEGARGSYRKLQDPDEICTAVHMISVNFTVFVKTAIAAAMEQSGSEEDDESRSDSDSEYGDSQQESDEESEDDNMDMSL